LDTIWRVPDALWETVSKVLATYDPAARTGRPRVDQRRALDGIIFRMRTGCQWNHLPTEFGDDVSVYRTFRRWESKGIFDILWAVLLVKCEELQGVDWQWQAADGCLGKARGVPKKGKRWMPPNVSAPTQPTAPRRVSRRACLSRDQVGRLLSA
jgi:putative transposase